MSDAPDTLPDHEPGARRLLQALVRAGLDLEALTPAARLCIALDERRPRAMSVKATSEREQSASEPDDGDELLALLDEAGA